MITKWAPNDDSIDLYLSLFHSFFPMLLSFASSTSPFNLPSCEIPIPKMTSNARFYEQSQDFNWLDAMSKNKTFYDPR